MPLNFHTDNRLIRDLITTGFFLVLGLVSLPPDLLTGETVYMGFVSGIAIGIGAGYLIRSIVQAGRSKQLIGSHITDGSKPNGQ